MVRQVSDETRAKISKGVRRAWQRPKFRRKQSEAKRASLAVQANMRAIHARARGKPLKHKVDAWSSSMATKRLKAMGLKREDSEGLWQVFKQRYLKQIENADGST